MDNDLIATGKRQVADAHRDMAAAAENMKNLLIKFKAANAEITDAWKGHSGDTFAEVTKELESRFENLNNALSLLINEIDAAANAACDRSQ